MTLASYKIFIGSLVLMAVFLNQSSVISGVNISFADLFCFIVLIFLLFKYKLLIPLRETVFFLIVSVICLVTSMLYIPLKNLYIPEAGEIFSNYIKLAAVFVYFIVGYNISKLNILERVLKWYSITSLIIGLTGGIFTILNIRLLYHILYDGGIRFKGFMNDPNYFSILQVTSLCFFMNQKKLKVNYKLLIAFFISLGVIVSGSKTGFVTLLCYIIIRLSGYARELRKKSSIIYVCLVLLVLIFIVLSAAFGLFKEEIINMQTAIPVFNRLKPLLTGDISAAISEGGSSRFFTWETALKVIATSPFFGIGIGTYAGVAYELVGSQNIAHNTYLQLSAEWGIPLTGIFFLYIFNTLREALHLSKKYNEFNSVMTDMIVVLLISSVAISLNNARIFWFCLGMLVYNTDLAKIRGRNNEKGSFSINVINGNI